MNDDSMAGFFIDGWYVFDNFAPFQIEWRGKLYVTSEHAYQAAHFFDTDPGIAENIRNQLSPRLASDMANEMKEKEDPNWADRKVGVMEELVRCKFEQHEFIRTKLMDTGDKIIVEMNDGDSFWGWGPDHNGRNELGKIWMRLRGEIKE